MSVRVAKQAIKQWCGPVAYAKGERLCRADRVAFLRFEPDSGRYAAEVDGTERHAVELTLEPDGKPDAHCTCPALGSFPSFCHHIAAVLLRLHELQQTAASSPRRTSAGNRLEAAPGSGTPLPPAERLLGLFDDKPVRPLRNRTLAETRTPLEVAFILRILESDRISSLFGLELKVGLRTPYIVRNPASFLDQLERGESFPLARTFSYDPELHCFAQADEAVLRAMARLLRDRAAYREIDGLSNVYAAGRGRERLLPIPPQAWTDLLPLLRQAPKVAVLDGDAQYGGLDLSEEPLPLRFELREEEADTYALRVQGLDRLSVMAPYGTAFQQGKLYPLTANQGKQLEELKAILDETGGADVPIPGGQVAAFLEKAVPGLMKLGAVNIAPALDRRIAQFPLQAKLYLDRVKDRLLAALEFHYGQNVVNPLEESGKPNGGGPLILRDRDRERQILDVLEQCPFAKTESGYVLSDEEAEFDFLHAVVPQLKLLVKVYATTAVKLRVLRLDEQPRVSVRVSAAERMNWLEFRLNMGWIPETEIRGLVKSIQEKRRYYRLPNGSLLPLDGAEFRRLSELLEETGLTHAELQGSTIQIPVGRGIPLIDRDSPVLQLDKPVRRLLANLRNPDNLGFPVPPALDSVLRGYQKLGYQWLKTLAHYRFGGILADDMGLGKTLQSIAFLASVLPEIREDRRPALVISPGSLVYNWRNELRKFAPEIRVLIADGTGAERARKLDRLTEADVVLTSYPLLLRDRTRYAKLAFHTLILDEAQAFKNHATQTARAVRSIQAGHRFALTGTPVENRMEELWSIFDVVFPGLFQDRKAFANLTHQEVSKRARPFMLRRWKRDVLQDLPEKTESVKPVELLAEQKKLYAAYLAKLQQETLKYLSVDGYRKSRIKILAGLTRLRQICCHPALFVAGYKGNSAKLEQLMDIVQEGMANRKRLLIFSQFTEMLGLIGRALNEQGLPFFYLDGSTPASERVELCERFNDGESDLFLISLKAGGTGLNLTGADTVVLYDLWWNPAVEQQAADRAHRIGQKNVVQVIRLIARDTLEEKMYELQHRKKRLIDELTVPDREALSSLSEQELREILML